MASSRKLRRLHFVLGATSAFVFGASSIHCGAAGSGSSGTGSGGGFVGTTSSSAGGGTGTSTMSGGTGGDIDIDVYVPDYTAEQFFDDDPPPMMCNEDGGGMPPPPPGGTPECPDDKNLEGCPCSAAGETAACWPGKRKNRNHGICHDGKTTCKLTGENNLSWGPCVGYQLPTGAAGKAACGCFSGGHWDIDNLSPCFFSDGSGNLTHTVSTTLQGGNIACPATPEDAILQDWSTDNLKVDCTGYFKLCYSLKAGDGKNPQPGDCEIIKVCSEGHYAPANATIPFPPLPGWIADPATLGCAEKFIDTGGYGEMSVVGQSDECEGVNKVFQHVTYCPLLCNDGDPSNDPPICAMCTPGGGGNF